MKPTHVPGFLMTHSAMAFVLGLLCAWAIDLGDGVQAVVLGTKLAAGQLVGAGAAATRLSAIGHLYHRLARTYLAASA